MKKANHSAPKDKCHVTTRTTSARINEKTTPVLAEKMESTGQTSQSLSTRKTSSLSARLLTTARSQSASPVKSLALLKRLNISSPSSKDPPDEKRRKIGLEVKRGRTRTVSGKQISSPAKREKKRQAELKKLMTTDGFWAAGSPAGERDPSQTQKRASSLNRASRTTTPEGLTGKKPVKTQQAKSMKPEKDQPEKEASCSGSLSELRRLQTTEGFWSPSNILPDSRDASPASTSSLERSVRHKSQQKKSASKVVSSVSAGSHQDIATTRLKRNDVKNTPARPSSAPENLTVSRQDGAVASRAKFVSNNLRKKSFLQKTPTRFGKIKEKLPTKKFVETRKKGGPDVDNSMNVELPSLQEQSEDLKRSLRKRKKEEEDDKMVQDNDLQKGQSVTSKLKPVESAASKIVQRKGREEAKEHTKRFGSKRNSPASSLERKQTNSELDKERITPELRRTRLKTAGEEISTANNTMVESECKAPEVVVHTENLEDLSTLSPPQNASSKLAISDLLGSGELKRLDTTPGFWAPSPDMSHVLGLSHSRRSPVSSKRPSRHSKIQISPKKQESSLLQLRKKKLSVLQKQHQLKQQTSKGEKQHVGEKTKRLSTQSKSSRDDTHEVSGDTLNSTFHKEAPRNALLKQSCSNNSLQALNSRSQSNMSKEVLNIQSSTLVSRDTLNIQPPFSIESNEVSSGHAQPSEAIPLADFHLVRIDTNTEVNSTEENEETKSYQELPKHDYLVTDEVKHDSAPLGSSKVEQLEITLPDESANDIPSEGDKVKQAEDATKKCTTDTNDADDKSIVVSSQSGPTSKLESNSKSAQLKSEEVACKNFTQEAKTPTQLMDMQLIHKEVEHTKVQVTSGELKDEEPKAVSSPTEVLDSCHPKRDNNANIATTPTLVSSEKVSNLGIATLIVNPDSGSSKVDPYVESKISADRNEEFEVNSKEDVKEKEFEMKLAGDFDESKTEEKPSDDAGETHKKADDTMKEEELKIQESESKSESKSEMKPRYHPEILTEMGNRQPEGSLEKSLEEPVSDESMGPEAKTQDETPLETASDILIPTEQPMLTSEEVNKSSQIHNTEVLPSLTDSTCMQITSLYLNNDGTGSSNCEDSSEVTHDEEPLGKTRTVLNPEASIKSNSMSHIPITANETCSGAPLNTETLDTSDAAGALSGLQHCSQQKTASVTEEVKVLNQSEVSKVFIRDLSISEESQDKPTSAISPMPICPQTTIHNQEIQTAEFAKTTMSGVHGKCGSQRDPLRRVYKKKRNAWRKGILQRATKMYRKGEQSTESISQMGQVVQAKSMNDDGEITPLEDQSLVTDSQNLTNTIRDAKKSAKELRKSLILRRLQTDANLAGGTIDNSQLLSSGRNLREVQPKNKTVPALRKEIASDVNVISSSLKLKTFGKRPPGRPRKHKRKFVDGLPKLVLSTQTLGGKKVHRRWYKTPPKLSPQPVDKVVKSKNTVDKQEPEFVSESVDESDIHLYLSGVSDDEPSSSKRSGGNDLRDTYQPLDFAQTLAISETAVDKYDTNTTRKTHRIVKNKVKGKKGKPPGTPMTEEEKSKVRSSLLARFDDYANFKMPRTARKSTFTPSLYLSSNVSQFPPKKFSLRQKTTRSPLEMLEMKRKQEEAIYDMEEEKRLAKRINRLEKRYSQASPDESFEDEFEDLDWEIKDCSVVLYDFVKKLHLENIDLPPAEDGDQKSESGEEVNSAVDEDWCADLEDFQDVADEEWTAHGESREKRPFIPRLKLKRVQKVGKEKKSKSHKSKKKPKFICPQQDAQQPLKLVIKAEVPSACTAEKLERSGPAVDVSTMQRKGFEGSFVDFLQGKKTDEFMHLYSKRRSDTNSNDGRLIMNLGDVGGLKSNSPPKQKSSHVINSKANDDIGAMKSSYSRNQNSETRGGEKHTNLSSAFTEPKIVGTKETSVSPAEKDKQDCPGVYESSKQSQVKESPSPEICSSNGHQKGQASEKTLESSIVINNNNIENLSPKEPQQTQVSHALDRSHSLKDSTDPIAKRPATSPLPEGWKVKVIQQPDKQFSGKRFKCKRCSFNTVSQLTMESHIYSHIPGVQFRCAYCESEFTSMAATASHMKKTHQLGEARLQISRQVDEHNFYDVEDAPGNDEQPQHGASPRGGTQVVVSGGDGGQGGQSPPVLISVLVSSGAAAGAGNHGTGVFVRPANATAPGVAVPSTNRRRYVCTHCGFSTNVHADAKHHVSDLHPDSSIFACSLCKEDTYYSESEIKQHAASVHPSRIRPYRRLPDFYDAEKLSITSLGCEDCLGDVGVSVFSEGEDSSPVDHRQCAKDYLQLQEGLKQKRSAEADSTTAADYMECEEQEREQREEPVGSVVAEADSSPRDKETPTVTSDISSSAVCSSQLDKYTGPETEGSSTCDAIQRTDDATPSIEAKDQPVCDEEGNNDDSPKLKIVEVVSLSNTDTQEFEESSGGDANICVSQTSSEETLSHSSTVATTSSSPSSVPPGSSVSSPVTTSSSSSAQPPVSQVAAPPQPGGGLPLSYKCSACRVHTPYLLMMVKHLKAKHPHMGCFSCPYCKTSAPPAAGGQPESFVTQKQLRTHIRRLHPDKTGRNEIALSAKAKQFVEAMVLPASPECTRVGNRLVLEEDIHTCTYCNLKMTSLASVYEHLNEVHADLFEFVCPICQSFKSKDLEAISVHSLEVHLSEVETDKVHVSVPKNLFSVLKCISKGGKYIEKQLDGSYTSSSSKSSTPNLSAADKDKLADTTATSPALSTPRTVEENAPLDLTSASQSITRSPAPAHSPAISHTGLKSPALGPQAPTLKPAQLNFSSALFDTSSMSVAPQITGNKSSPVPAAAASSFLSPSPGKKQQASTALGKQGTKSKTASPLSAKALPVLNVPTIKPRPQPSSSAGARPRLGEHSSTSSKSTLNLAARIPVISHTASVVTSSTSQHPLPFSISLPTTASSLDDLPDDEPAPDAFKIFNLQPTPPLVNSPASLGVVQSPSPGIPSSSPAVPTVFPPVSTQLNPAFIQGPIVGFPAGMVISPALLPPHASFSQQQQALFHSARPAQAMFATGSTSTASFTPPQRPKSTSSASANTLFLKEQQKKELLLLKQQHQQQKQAKEKQRMKQLEALQRAQQARQNEMIRQAVLNQQHVRMLSQTPFSSFPVSQKIWPPQRHILPPNTNDSQSPAPSAQSRPPSSIGSAPSPSSLGSTPFTSPLGSSPSISSTPSASSPMRPGKGVHKRSSSLYQCPYCPTPITLKALDVASHIHQKHPRCQVVFKKATS